MAVPVSVKWGKEKLSLELDLGADVATFKAQLYALTGVPVDRQKIMGVKGGQLKDDADWTKVGVKSGHTFMLIGTAEEIRAPEQPTVFVEDLPEDMRAAAESTTPPGLENLGNTCYLNSALQCMNAIDGLQEMVAANTNNPPLVNQLKQLFGQLRAGGDSLTPTQFVNMFRQQFPQFAQRGEGGVYRQQDANEAWELIIKLLSEALRPTGGVSPIDRILEGRISSKMSTAEAPDEPPSLSSDSFRVLQCHITSETNYLIDGIKKGLNESINKNSPTLGRDANYTKSSQVSHLPPVLVVQFVRFFWKGEKPLKIVRPVEFPFTLDMFDFCTDELKEKLKVKRRELQEKEDQALEAQRAAMTAAAGAASSSSSAASASASASSAAPVPTAMETDDKKSEKSDDSKMETDQKPADDGTPVNETGRYELCAVITHQGRYADSGHYIGWVKDQNYKPTSKKDSARWFKFDDDKVSIVKDEDVHKLTGKGGADHHMAYMCVYRSRKGL